MALNFDGQEEIAPGVNAFRFKTPDGKNWYERDPMKAMQLGMPPDFANAAQKPAAPPDMRLASNAHQAPAQGNGPGFATQEELLRSKLEAPDTPAPMAAQQAEQKPQRDPNAEFENSLNEAVPLPQRYKRAAAREAGYTPESMQVSGADPKALEKLATQYDKLETKRMEVAEAQLEATQHQAIKDQFNAQSDALEAQDKIVAQERKVKFQEDAKRRHMAALDTEEQRVAKQTPDADRFFKKAGTGSFFLAALMQGLGEIGAAMRKDGRNPARDIINKRIEQDIDEQVAEVAADKDAVAKQKNAYASMLADGMDPEFAREKLRWLQGVKAESVAREAAATTASAQAQQHFLAQADEWAAENLKFKAGLIDKQDVKTSLKYDRGSAGGVYEDPNYYKNLESAVGARNTLRAEAMGTTPDAYQAGKKQEATAAVTGGEKIPVSTVTSLNEAISNVRAADKAVGDLDTVLSDKDADINLHPSTFRAMQPFTEFTQGERAAAEDRYGAAGAKVRDIVGTEMTSTRSPALGSLSESDKKNQTDNAIADGDPATIKRYFETRKQGYQSQLVQVFNAMSPAEQRKSLQSMDANTRRMVTEALSKQREDIEPLDAQR
jgi:hypothetical protein